MVNGKSKSTESARSSWEIRGAVTRAEKTPQVCPVYSLQTLKDRIVTMDLIEWRVVRALAQRDRQFFDVPERLLVL